VARTKESSDGGRLSLGAQKQALTETVRLVWRYVLQETLDPLKTLAKRAVFALAAMTVLAIGLLVLLIALLRVLQTETGTLFAGGWNFAPYLLTAMAAVLVLGVSVAIGMRSRSRHTP
jgi:hypothetical protein